ncbi:MAG: SusD/RagB family nutrient-binding outer membrane lipoprotein, partial [Bacteroidales bacterium]|nr:SusD/RagB family nutrient-binding outer membrane lipoprotein [Bacteroidales bacterium]
YGAGNIGNFGQVYLNYVRPAEFSAPNKFPGASPTDENYWFRRYSQCSHETNYNKDNAKASNPLALDFANGAIWSDPVWWDKAE